MSIRLRFVLGLLSLFLVAPAAHALRCGNRVVGNDDYDFQVRDRCGAPFYIEQHFRLIVSAADSSGQTLQQTTYTAWYYNFGADRLLVRLLFRDNRLVREDTLGRGVDELGDSCGPTKMLRGMSSGELIAYCGEPLSRNPQPITKIRQLAPGVYSQSDYAFEDWIYDLGGNFLYILHIINGHVDSVDHVPR